MDLEELERKVIEFRDARDWAQYHNPKDLAISLMLETAELLEVFQWKDAGEVEQTKVMEKLEEGFKRKWAMFSFMP